MFIEPVSFARHFLYIDRKLLDLRAEYREEGGGGGGFHGWTKFKEIQ